MTFTKEDWKIAEVQLDDQKLFVLWAIRVSFCRTVADFEHHFRGEGITGTIRELEEDKFVLDHGGVLCLTESGVAAVSVLPANEMSAFAQDRIAALVEQLPQRTVDIVRIPPTAEQLELHDAHIGTAKTIARKKYLTEMDLLRLQKALLMCRMSADSTYLIDKKEPSYSSKLDYLSGLLELLFAQPDRKAVLFSEWTTMLGLIEPLLRKQKLDFVRLDGSVPQKKRQQSVHHFRNEESCKLFITTNAGSTGLNLQAANTVINVDLPWNPAVLEQRIARVHRLGQQQSVQVFVLVTEDTLEESLLATLLTKDDLASAVLDAESHVSNVEELKRRLDLLIGSQPEAVSNAASREQVMSVTQRSRIGAAGGELMGAAFTFLCDLVADQLVSEHRQWEFTKRGEPVVEKDETGCERLTLTLPNRGSLASVLAGNEAEG